MILVETVSPSIQAKIISNIVMSPVVVGERVIGAWVGEPRGKGPGWAGMMLEAIDASVRCLRCRSSLSSQYI